MENIFNFKYLQTKIFNINIPVCLSQACTPQAEASFETDTQVLGQESQLPPLLGFGEQRHWRARVCLCTCSPCFWTVARKRTTPLELQLRSQLAMSINQLSLRATLPMQQSRAGCLGPPDTSSLDQFSALLPFSRQRNMKAQSPVRATTDVTAISCTPCH